MAITGDSFAYLDAKGETIRAVIVQKLEGIARLFEVDAERDEALAAHFRPEFNACWENATAGSGALINAKRAHELRGLVLTTRDTARRCREEALAIREAITCVKRVWELQDEIADHAGDARAAATRREWLAEQDD